MANVDGDQNYVRIQVLTNAGALDREKQIALVSQLPTWSQRPRRIPHWTALHLCEAPMLKLSIPTESGTLRRWYELVSVRASMSA